MNTTSQPFAPKTTSTSLTLGDLIDEHVLLAETCLRQTERIRELEDEVQGLLADKMVYNIFNRSRTVVESSHKL